MRYTLSLQVGLRMKSNISDSVIATLLMLAVLFIAYWIGYEMSERKNCIANSGHYSWDYGECIDGGVK